MMTVTMMTSQTHMIMQTASSMMMMEEVSCFLCYSHSIVSLYSSAIGSSGSKYDGDSEDSDWVPEEEGKKEGEGNNEEDVSELVADAEEFIRNKKMRR